MSANEDFNKDGSDARVDVHDVEVGDANQVPTKLSFSALMTMLFSSTALISDGYNIAIIGNVSLFLKKTYPDVLTTTLRGRIANSFLIGQIIGLLGFGTIVDKYGRQFGGVATTLILILGVAISAAASGTTHLGLIWMLIVGRGVAGIGAGGEYPVCTASAAESSNDHPSTKSHRGFITAAATIVSIDLGFVLASLIPLILLLITHGGNYNLIWRLSVGLGLILPLSIFYFRLVMKPSSTYKKFGTSTLALPYGLIVKKYWKAFIGTAGSWAMYNWVAVPFSIFASTIAAELNPGGSLIKDFGYSTLIQAFCVPGGFVGGWCADRYGRKRTLIVGFTLQAILGFILAGAIRQIQTIPVLFLIIYGIFLFLGEAGPGSTVFVITAEAYPTVIRGAMIGLSAAFAKAAAAISTQVFNPILAAYPSDPIKGQQVVFFVGSAFCAMGAILAYFFVAGETEEDGLDHAEVLFDQYRREEEERHRISE